ncbi:cell division protein FtsX [Saccharopolyspora sp. NFXS83]|uniref:FtsX-like permease family protein n=1 Tax=Saccharopolyspora sp. NFXS83 TaxID=2993560 RepID=UPI00224A939A|nr:FtsX-like permease family protein [Saccharopolyspora sp. NFXS83]MCX2730235.1 cell division protein FtsX [Saccharopolyspora sp. NFXS83]
MSRLRTWATDLVLGVRLAIGDRHTPWGRLALMTVGVGVGVAVLLASAALPTWLDGRNARSVGREMQSTSSATTEIPAAVLGADGSTSFRDERIRGMRVQAQRPDAPVPAGLHRLPGPGELVVSPALGELLAQPDSELLRQRLDGRIVGHIGDAGLLAPGELYYYAGTADLTEWNATYRVDERFGENSNTRTISQDAWLMWLMGICVLLLPVIVFVVSTARLAEAARQRRLAALRLVGAGARQVRRIASGESLVGALAGVVAGWAMFLTCRAVAGNLEVVADLVAVADFAPVWWLAILITAGVPAMTVIIALSSLRGAVRDPLRWVRHGMPARRRLWVRCVPLVLGVAGIVLTAAVRWSQDGLFAYVLIGSITLVLVSVPLLLPWTVDALARLSRGGPVAWQLALRRLHFTSGTAARSVSAIAVVLTGVIGLQTLVASIEAAMYDDRATVREPGINVSASEDLSGRDGLTASLAEIRSLPGVRAAHGGHSASLSRGSDDASRSVMIVDCDTITRSAQVGGCADGTAYRTEDGRGETDAEAPADPPMREGQLWEISGRGSNANGAGTVAWVIPPVQDIEVITDELQNSELVLTPGAATGIPMEMRSVWMDVEVDEAVSPELLESVRNVVAANLSSGSVFSTSDVQNREDTVQQVRAVKYALLLGALVTFSLIGCSLLVTAIEQIQERTRPMAVLGAVGARRSTLVWSAFLQNAVPMLLTAVLAVPIGLGLGTLLIVTLFENYPVFDLAGMGVVLSFAAVSVLVVTALTAPALSRAMSSEGLHTE